MRRILGLGSQNICVKRFKLGCTDILGIQCKAAYIKKATLD